VHRACARELEKLKDFGGKLDPGGELRVLIMALRVVGVDPEHVLGVEWVRAERQRNPCAGLGSAELLEHLREDAKRRTAAEYRRLVKSGDEWRKAAKQADRSRLFPTPEALKQYAYRLSKRGKNRR
jgi:hypothetical protein